MARLQKKVIDGIAPVTLADCVYMGDGTDKNIKYKMGDIQSSIEKQNTNINNVKDRVSTLEGKISDTGAVIVQDLSHVAGEAEKLYPQLKNFKGEFPWSSLTEESWDNSQLGDYYINTSTELKSYHCYLHYPGNIMWFDGKDIAPLYMPKHKANASLSHYDVCIVGGGAGAMGCAYALRNLGLKVVLIEKLDSLGGTHINSPIPLLISSPISGTWFKDICRDGYEQGVITIHGTPKETGDAEDVFDRYWLNSMYTTDENNRGNQFVVPPWWTSQRYLKDLTDGGIEVLLKTELVSSECHPTNETQVLGINVRNLDTGCEYYIGAEYFVDCSADGVLCRYDKQEGVDFFIGSDGNERFNETAYKNGTTPDRYKINCVEAGYRICGDSYLRGDKVRTEDRSKWKTYTDINNKTNGGGTFEGHKVVSTSTGNSIDPHIFIDKGNDIAHSYGTPRAMAHCKIVQGTAWCFAEPCKMLGIRESYRIKCDKMLTQADCETSPSSATIANDHIIALSSWYVDIHNDSILQNTINNTWLNGIPYETLIPSAFTNVLIGSRCLGSSHIANASFRLTRTMMAIGYACGHAMKQCVSGWLNDVRDVNIAQLQTDVEIASLISDIERYFINND